MNNLAQFGTSTQFYGGIVPLPGTLGVLPTPSTGLQGLAGNFGLGKAGIESASRSDHALLPSAKLQYQVTPDLMAYASYDKGFLAGGFNGQDNSGDPRNLPFNPENVDAYEVGFKSELFDHRLLLNVDAFRSEYSNLQVQIYVPSGGNAISVVRNAAQSITQGFESEAKWRVTDALTLSADVAYDDAHYVSYQNVGLTQLQTFCHTATNRGNSICVGKFGGSGDPGAFQDLSGEPTANAPKWSGDIAGTYEFAVNDYKITTTLMGIFSSSYFLAGPGTNDPDLSQKGYVRLDGQVTLAKDDWAIDLIGKNLTNHTIAETATLWPLAAGSNLQTKQDPWSLVAQFRYRW
jgi:iron complex outermembrane recepter protein